MLVTAQRFYAELATAQRLILCWSQIRDLGCVGHSSEAYAVLVTAQTVLVTAQRLMLSSEVFCCVGHSSEGLCCVGYSSRVVL